MDMNLLLRVCSVGLGVFLLVMGIMQNLKFRKVALDDTRREVNEQEEIELAEKLTAIGPSAREVLYNTVFKIDRDKAMADEIADSILVGKISITRDLIQDKLIEKYPDKKPDQMKIKAYKGFVEIIRTISRLLAKQGVGKQVT